MCGALNSRFNDVTQCFSVHTSSQLLDSMYCCCIINLMLQSYRQCRAACRNALLLCGQVYWSLLYSAAATSAPSLSERFPRSADIMGCMEDFCFSSFVFFFSLRPCLCYLFITLSVIITKDKVVVSSTFLYLLITLERADRFLPNVMSTAVTRLEAILPLYILKS
jgi:hypothetical protein